MRTLLAREALRLRIAQSHLRSALQDFCDETADYRAWPGLDEVRVRALKLLKAQPLPPKPK